jgi:Zn-dependent protease
MSEPNIIQIFAIIALPLLFAITIHEAAHGWVANKFGDPTAKMMGRLTLNPIKHIDPVGTIAFPLLMLLMSSLMGGSPFLFGWAKPVPITVQNLHRPKQDMAWVALAGPGSNLLMALIWAMIAKLGVFAYSYGQEWIALPIISMGVYGILINLVLMVLNLLPVPPLDGGRVLVSVLPGPMAWQLSRLEPYGIYIVLALIFFGGWQAIIQPIVGSLSHMIRVFFGLPI